MTNPTLQRLAPLDPETATGRSQELLGEAQTRYGFVSNLLRVFAHTPAVLNGYLNFDDALAHGTFDARIREQIALAVAEANLCSYCLSIHSFIGGRVGLTAPEISAARQATAAERRTDGILKLARSIIVLRGEISDGDLNHARVAGLTDGDIVETVANVALNTFLNYMNHVARPAIDFPEVRPGVGYDEPARASELA